MIVYMYEKLSQRRPHLCRPVRPQLLQHQRLHQPGLPRLRAGHRLHAAPARVVRGRVRHARSEESPPDGDDRSRSASGCVGHSWGGFDAAFLATNTHGVFAAAVAGAPITDLVSITATTTGAPGIAETDHIETGQERMEVPLYEDLQDYIDNSAVFQHPQDDRAAPARRRRRRRRPSSGTKASRCTTSPGGP